MVATNISPLFSPAAKRKGTAVHRPQVTPAARHRLHLPEKWLGGGAPFLQVLVELTLAYDALAIRKLFHVLPVCCRHFFLTWDRSPCSKPAFCEVVFVWFELLYCLYCAPRFHLWSTGL